MLQEPRICQVIAATTLAEARALMRSVAPGVDLLELRIDLLCPEERRPADVAALVAIASRPVIATCRPRAERGGHPDDDAARELLLRAALDAGALLADLEWSWWRRDPGLSARFPTARTLLSHHEWDAIPTDLETQFEQMVRQQAAAWKLAVQVEDFGSALRLVALAGEASRRGLPVACFGLGPVGRVTRILAALRGAWLTYVTPDEGPAPPGDLLTVHEALNLYSLKSPPPHVKLLGVLGRLGRRSLSPQLHNHVIRRLGERYIYLPFDSPEARPVVEYMRRGELRGLSVTIPYKRAVLGLLDSVDRGASEIGAVNTIVRHGDALIGYNTDRLAARQIVGQWQLRPGDPVAVLGAGGAARAVVAALRDVRARITIINRDPARGRALAREVGAEYGGTVPAVLEGIPLRGLINTTPLGAGDETIPGLPPFDSQLCVLDLAYRRGATPLELQARVAGARVTGGLEFLARQAACQFTLWTGRQVPPEVYLHSLRAAIPEAVESFGPFPRQVAEGPC